MGLQLSSARLGTALALFASYPLAVWMGGVAKPVFLGLILICIGMISFFLYTIQDKKLDKSVAEEAAISGSAEEESFKMADMWFILKNKGWWYIAILCVLFYSAVFPFLKYASDLMVNKFGVNPLVAGTIPSLLPFGTILLTPLFGSIYDRKGKGCHTYDHWCNSDNSGSYFVLGSVSQFQICCNSSDHSSWYWIFACSFCNVAISS